MALCNGVVVSRMPHDLANGGYHYCYYPQMPYYFHPGCRTPRRPQASLLPGDGNVLQICQADEADGFNRFYHDLGKNTHGSVEALIDLGEGSHFSVLFAVEGLEQPWNT